MSTLSVSKYRAHDHAPLHSPACPAALACRLPVGPFLLGTCLPTLRVPIARLYTAAYYEDVCRHSRRLVLAADRTADVWRKQHAMASAEPRTTVGVAPGLIAPTLFLAPLEKVLNNASLRSARTWSNLTSSAPQSRLHSHAPSNIRTLSNERNLGALTHSLACPRAPSLAPIVPPSPSPRRAWTVLRLQPTALRDYQERTDGALFGALGIRTSKLQSAGTLARKDGIPLRPRSHLGPFLLRPRSHSRPLPLCSILAGSLSAIDFPLRHRRCRCRDAKHVGQGARWHGRAPGTDSGAHVRESSVRRLCKLHSSDSTACTIQRTAHLQHATCHAARIRQTAQCASAFAVQPIDSGHAS